MRSALARPSSAVLRARVGVAFAALFSLGSLAGCDHDAEERQLDEMNSTIREVQAERDKAEADMTVEAIADSHLASTPERTPAPSSPPPEVVPIGVDGQLPPEEGEAADTEDPSPRPTIRVIGSPRVGRGGWQGDQVDESNVDRPTAPPPSSALDPAAKPAYEAALALVGARQYDRALDALAAFLVKYPDHPYADNAMYWRGECYFAKGDYLHAAEQFEGTVTRFPAGNKAPDAMLKLGMSQQKLGNPVKAKEIFDRLAQTYPQSEAVRHIPPVLVPATGARGPGSEDHR
jgi:tol-pal system protein YbgF